MTDIQEAHRKAVVQNGTVVNIIMAPHDFELEGAELVTSETAEIGDEWDGSEFTTPPAPPAPFLPIEAWRFEAAIQIAGIKDQIDAAIEDLPEPDRTVAKAKRARIVEYHRNDPLIAALAPAVNLDEAAVDALWRTAEGL